MPWLAAAACGVGAIVGTCNITTQNESQPAQAHITKADSAARRLRLMAGPAALTHRALQELNEQPEAIARTLNFGECMTFEKVLVSDLDQNQDKVTKINHLTLSAQGTSLHAARYGERLMKHLGAFTSVESVDSAEMQTPDNFRCLDVDDRTGLIVLSDCGSRAAAKNRTRVPDDVVASLMEKGVTVMNVVNTLTSLLASADKADVFGSGSNVETMSSTKVFTTQVTVLALISLWFKESRDREAGSPSPEALELKEALMRLPIVFGMTLRKREQCREIAKRLLDEDQCLVLGTGRLHYGVPFYARFVLFIHLRVLSNLPIPFNSKTGFAEPVAHEGACIMSEISNINSSSSLTSTIKAGTPIIAFLLKDDDPSHLRRTVMEAKAKGADVFVITDDESLAEGLDNSPIVLPANGPMTALGGILPVSLLAYELAMLR